MDTLGIRNGAKSIKDTCFNLERMGHNRWKKSSSIGCHFQNIRLLVGKKRRMPYVRI